MNDLKPGQELTYEQVMALPDGAVISALWGDYNIQAKCVYEIGGLDANGIPHKFEGATLDDKNKWAPSMWHDVTLVSLPRDSQEIISEKLSQSAAEQAPLRESPLGNVCDLCGATYKNNERHTCAPKPETVQGSELAKRAALALLDSFSQDFGDNVTDAHARETWRDICARYIEAYDYAKSIGAI